ncbi:MAG: ShlB/FhaC/HecB family hemolysin secretion/activation protein [Chlorobium sp.]|nr:MAG: ShlB/FhaC/HecB family hemolysin secretion/activation protein [Chlorobium sp.]
MYSYYEAGQFAIESDGRLPMKTVTRASRLLAILSLFSAASLQAQTIPDAGSILRDQKPVQEQLRQLPLPQEKKSEPSKADDGIRVDVKGFIFSGYEGVATEAQLREMVASAIGKTLSFRELQLLVDNMTALFKEKGFYQAKAWLPPQDITPGIIHIAVTLVKSDGRIDIKRDNSVRIADNTLLNIGISAVRKGEPVNEHHLERSLLLMNDLPGITAKASLVPGTESGTSGVDIAVTEGPIFSGAAWSDNQGSVYTGLWRGNATLSINDPLRYGDQLTLLMTKASGLVQGRIGYSIPLMFHGIRANLAYTGMRYDLGGELASLQLKGESSSYDAGLSYPLLRSRTSNITTSLSCGYRALTDSNPDSVISDKQLNNATFTVSGDRYDQLFSGGYTTYNLGATIGTLHESIAEINLTGTEGGYTRFNTALARFQRLSERVSINISATTQVATSNLNSSEKMSLGGPGSIRAYPVSEASGDEGELYSAELGYALPLPAQWGSFQISTFYDAGHITLNHDRFIGDVTNATSRNDYWLQGGGIGLICSLAGRGSLRASWAFRIGDNPGRSDSGKNSDGRSDSNRFWLQAMLSF